MVHVVLLNEGLSVSSHVHQTCLLDSRAFPYALLEIVQISDGLIEFHGTVAAVHGMCVCVCVCHWSLLVAQLAVFNTFVIFVEVTDLNAMKKQGFVMKKIKDFLL